jgi:hypothetical protein
MMKLQLVLLGFALLSASVNAQTTDSSKTINQLGLQSSSPALAYFGAVEGFTLNCEFGLIYTDITTTFGQAAYANLLAAKIAGRMLSRITYTQPGGSGTVCTLTLVEVQN